MTGKPSRLLDLAKFCEMGDSGSIMADEIRDYAIYMQYLEGAVAEMVKRIERQARTIERARKVLSGEVSA
jgi:hypothetical protein